MQSVSCPVCRSQLSLSSTHSRKKSKLGLMLVCPVSGVHFRAFINDQAFVRRVMNGLETLKS